MALHVPRAPFAISIVIALLLVACGGGTGAPPATDAPAAAATPAGTAVIPNTPAAPLTVAVISLTVGNKLVYIAKSEGYFDQLQLPVTIMDNTGPNLLNLVVSGQADVGYGGLPTAFLPVPEGKPTSILFTYQGNGAGGFVVGAKNIKSLDQVKRLGAGVPGTSTFGYCNWYKQSLKASFDCVPMESAARRSAVLSGQIDAALDVYAQLVDPIARGDLNVLIDTRDAAVRKKYIGDDFGETAIFALTDVIKAKSDSFVRFMRAIGMAMKFADTKSDDEIAATLKKLKTFETFTVAQLAAQEKGYRQFNHPNQGYITEANWTFALQQYAGWGLGAAFDPKSPTYSYAQRVDMSFYDRGIGKPQSTR